MRRSVVLLALAALNGCAMKLNGFVSDARTHRPIGGARILADERITYTKDTGSYLLKVHREPRAIAEVSAPGYETSVVTCDAPTNHPVCDVALTPR